MNTTLAVAESCTGGLLAGAITEIPGSSRIFLGGVVAYSNTSKIRLLGVPAAVVEEHGAVSQACAAAMAEGVRDLFGADIALSITGIAGPGGGSSDKPVGTIWFGFSQGDRTKQLRLRFAGARGDVRSQAQRAALQILLGDFSAFER
jgi:PncC family amidohydrolase